jgi:type I restriction enzyme S subunit
VFAVKQGELVTRIDVNYWASTRRFSDRYANPIYPLVPLREQVLLVQYGCSDLANTEGKGLRMVRMNNLQDDGWDFSDVKRVPLGLKAARRYRLRRGDILFNRTNSKELVGKCEVFRERGVWVFASYLIRVRVDEQRLLPDFVPLFLATSAGRIQIDRISRQIIGMTNVNAEELQDLLLPLPDVPRQRELLVEMDAAREARKEKLREADELLVSLDTYLLETLALTPPPPDNRQIYAVRLNAVRSESRLNADYFHPERILTLRTLQQTASTRLDALVTFHRDLRTADARPNYLGLAHVQSHTGELVTFDEGAEGQCFAFLPGDVLFARLRPYLNKVYCAEHEGVCSTEFHVMRVNNPAALLPEYLATMLRSRLIVAQTRHMMTGNTHPRLTNDDVVNLVVPVPEIAVQEQIAAEVRRRREQARRLRIEADAEWQAAKRRFEQQLLGTEQQ